MLRGPTWAWMSQLCTDLATNSGPMVGDALQALQDNAHVELVVRGTRPKWPAGFADKMDKQGMWLVFAPRVELDEWLESADAFLVPMVFDLEMRRPMETSFPSKLIEFAQFGKPLVVLVRNIARRCNGRGVKVRRLVWWTQAPMFWSISWKSWPLLRTSNSDFHPQQRQWPGASSMPRRFKNSSGRSCGVPPIAAS